MITIYYTVTYLFIYDVVHDLEPLHRFLFCDSDVLLFERHGTEAVVKVEESDRGVYAQEGGHVLVVGECGTKTDQTHLLLGRLYVTDGP